MNQGNNNLTNGQVNCTNVTPQPVPATPSNVTPQPVPATPSNVSPQPVPANPNTAVKPTPVATNTNTGLNFASAPEAPTIKPAPAQAPVQQQVQNIQSVPAAPQAQKPSIVAPTQTVINTTKKKGGNILLFIIIILIGVFIYYIDDVLAYFNQKNSPIVDDTIKENASANLVDGYIIINSENSYIKLKGIKFNNFKKSSDDVIVFSYASDKNYSNSNNLNIAIELFDENKTVIHSEQFNVFGTIEAGSTRQYKMSLSSEIYEYAFYALVSEKTISSEGENDG